VTALSFGVLCFSSLFTVIDPLAAVPVFASLTQGEDKKTMRKIAIRSSAVALGVLLVFALSGAFVFRLFGITIDAFRIGGGLVFLMIGLPMLRGSHGSARAALAGPDPSVVPLGVPIITGPGAITTVMVLMGQSTSAWHGAALIVATVLVLLATCAILLVSPAILRRVGPTGLELLTRVMGLIVVVIGVQLMLDGLRPIAVDILRSAGR
jgi:multiple antibiotic resistance protein